ncbi:MAG TPA: 23S rRNA (adenine(2030)-N(6))-methyltransferase RlmJ [Gammaproteobacteria bacterium]|nr:23S rRNA (adenine(2030)-N(6))-methyltransferase RlmJ [Gammaproteobacteria bacterium]
MNYRHLFHAGNFADVVKHVVIVGLIASLLRKDKPFCFLDTHAGKGYYDLMSEIAQKNKEHKDGIMKILSQENPPGLIKRYLGSIQKINSRLSESRFASMRFYPGSPFIVRPFLRPGDRIIATELHPQEYQALKKACDYDRQISTHQMDGYLGLKAFLPPKERRGLVLIDPPYENPDEFRHLIKALTVALKRWETGIYAIWYPIKERTLVDQFHHALKETVKKEIMIVELSIYPEDVPSHLNGCGMAIINPPWKFDQEMNNVIPWLWKVLNIGHKGAHRVYQLNPPTGS